MESVSYTHTGRLYSNADYVIAPSDVDTPSYPVGPTGFQSIRQNPIVFRTIIIASDYDPFVTLELAQHFAEM